MNVTPAFRGSTAIASGRLTRGQLRGTDFLPVFRDIYVRRGQPLDLEARSRASTLLLPDGGVLAGHSAAVLWKAGCSTAEADVEIAVPGSRMRAQAGLVLHRGAVAPDEITTDPESRSRPPCAPPTTSRGDRPASRRSCASTPSPGWATSHRATF